MLSSHPESPPLLAFADSERSPSSIRAGALVFIDPRSRALKAQLEQLSPGTEPILIEGEQGTGKELLARQIHRGSERTGLFVAISGGSISPTQGEAELFGHAPGFSGGSLSSRAGWFGSAHGGTLYLEEIGDLSLALQVRLLDALEQGSVLRLGASQPTAVDVRLVASTSFDLQRAVQAGTFNPRLFERLQTGRLRLPPLRERPADILPLADYFLAYYCHRLNLSPPRLSEGARQRLKTQPWPGNTRELENCLHFALLVCEGSEILPHHLYLPHDSAAKDHQASQTAVAL